MQAGDRVRCIKPRGHDHLAISGVGEVVTVRGNLVRVRWATRELWFATEELRDWSPDDDALDVLTAWKTARGYRPEEV